MLGNEGTLSAILSDLVALLVVRPKDRDYEKDEESFEKFAANELEENEDRKVRSVGCQQSL